MKRKAKIFEVVMIRLLGLSWIGFVFYFGLMCVRCFVPGIVIKEGIENRYWPVKYGIGKTVVMTSFRNEFFALHLRSDVIFYVLSVFLILRARTNPGPGIKRYFPLFILRARSILWTNNIEYAYSMDTMHTTS